MSKPCIHILIGVAGSGKSTAVKEIQKKLFGLPFNVTTICPDELREKFCNGDRSDQSKNALVWGSAYGDAQLAMDRQEEIIFDSTMVSPKKRKQLIKMAMHNDYSIIAHVVERDEETIKKQNAGRKWEVPEYIIDNMIKSFVRPTKEEGFDSIVDH